MWAVHAFKNFKKGGCMWLPDDAWQRQPRRGRDMSDIDLGANKTYATTIVTSPFGTLLSINAVPFFSPHCTHTDRLHWAVRAICAWCLSIYWFRSRKTKSNCFPRLKSVDCLSSDLQNPLFIVSFQQSGQEPRFFQWRMNPMSLQ